MRGGGGNAPAYSARDLEEVAALEEIIVDDVGVGDEVAREQVSAGGRLMRCL